jgi:hypothetical protein
VISLYSQTGTPAWALWRPLIALLVGALAVEGMAYLAFRRTSAASLAACIVGLAFVALWVIALPILVVVLWFVAINRVRRGAGREEISTAFLERFASGIATISIVLIALVVAQAAVGGAFWTARQGFAADRPETTATLPNMYVLMLDGYPGSANLRERWGIDNSKFEAGLVDRGFDVAANSRSNYSTTWDSLAALFSMDYVQDQAETVGIPPDGPEQYRALGRLMNNGQALDTLHAAGYRIISGQSAYSDIALVRADEVSSAPHLTRFEEQLVEKSAVARWAAGWLAASVRDDVRLSLARAAKAASSSDSGQPSFLFDHVFSPHPPYVLSADGQTRDLPPCFPAGCSLKEPSASKLQLTRDQYAEALKDQLEGLNPMVLSTVDEIVKRDPGAVILILSDHATRYDLENDSDEAFENFFAARTPSHSGLFGESPTTVNILRVLLNAYLGTHLTELPYQAWLTLGPPLELTEVHP